MAIAENLKHHRMKMGMSQSDLAKESGISQALISYIENGDRKNPGIMTISKLADVLDVSVEELIK